jgi:hypothetical protein
MLAGLITLVAVSTSGGGDEPVSRASGGTVEAAPSARDRGQASAFYRDARLSLAHLLVHLGQQGQLFTELLAGSPPGPAVADLARVWAGDYATSRDLVGRLLAPAALPARQAQSFYRLAAMLYVESAQGLVRAASAGGEAGIEIAKEARRVQLLGDAAFDVGHRLLLPHTADPGALTVERLGEPAVPDFAARGVASATPSPPTGSEDVTGALGVIRRAVPWLKGAPAAGWDPAGGAARLTAAAEGLRRPGKASDAQGEEAAVVQRLALLVEADALRAGTSDLEAGRRLHLIGAELWSAASAFHRAAGGKPLPAFPTQGMDPAVLLAGGLFNGHPPPLRPGDPPDQDVPGGLPSLGSVLGTG